MKNLAYLLSGILLSVSFAAHSMPLSVVQCYIDPTKKTTVQTGCMSGRCMLKGQTLCLPLNSEDTVTLQYFNLRTNKALYAGDFPCTAPDILKQCQTYQGIAVDKARGRF